MTRARRPLFGPEIRAIAGVAILLGIIAMAVLADALWNLKMHLPTRKTIFAGIVALAAVSLALGGCTGITNLLQTGQPGAASVLGNLQQCDRHYEGALGAGMTGSFRIECKAQPPAPTTDGPTL